jgi:3-hydroxyacyl-[acyl-carrier-protein] dehydratase
MKDNFYTTSALEKGEGSLTCTIHYNAAHRIFEGHFPGNPIVPGVCTIAIVKELLEEAITQKLLLASAPTVKFLGLINPSMSPVLTLTWKGEGGQTQTTATLKEGPRALFKMSGTYASRK